MIRLNRVATGALGRFFLATIFVFALHRSLSAQPMVYTGVVVTDVRVGSTLFHNASLKITFAGDSNNILQVPVPSTECGGVGYFLYMTQGVARMEIEYQGRTRTARLNDGQVFVAVDECNGGIGFGSFTGPMGFEPAYPLALPWVQPNIGRSSMAVHYRMDLSVTGSAWSCIGFPPGGAGALNGTRER